MQDGPAAAGTVASVAKAKARARTIFVMRVSYGLHLVAGAGRMAERWYARISTLLNHDLRWRPYASRKVCRL